MSRKGQRPLKSLGTRLPPIFCTYSSLSLSEPVSFRAALQIESLFESLRLTSFPSRQALRYLIRNTTLPQSVRSKAQLQLSRMHCYTRGTQIRNRCTMGGVARGVFRDFRMARVSLVHLSLLSLWALPSRWQQRQ
jgi:ribosomal protein S14